MTEEEWLRTAAPGEMLYCIREQASHRKLRLLACECCRPLLENAKVAELALGEKFEAAEQFAEGLIAESRFLEHFSGYDPAAEPPDIYFDLEIIVQRTWDAISRLGWLPTEEPNWRL